MVTNYFRKKTKLSTAVWSLYKQDIMKQIKDILTIDLNDDIKNVIDLEDVSEAAIQSEIENYIITDGLAKEYSSFATIFTSNIIETGVWLSDSMGQENPISANY